jgi:hypothetical protein
LIILGSRLYSPDAPIPLLTGSLCSITIYGTPVAFPKLQMAPRLTFFVFSGSKKKEPGYACLNEVKASHRQRIMQKLHPLLHTSHTVASLSAPLSEVVFSVPVRIPVTSLDCFLLKDKCLALVPRQGPEINIRACLWVLQKIDHPPPSAGSLTSD